MATRQIDPDDPAKGSITYKGSINALKGVFATTFYFRDADCAECKDFKGQDAPWTKTDIYKTGLLHYLSVTDTPEFAGWKVVIYTDAHSLENPMFRSKQANARTAKHQAEWQMIAAHPNTVFAVVNWPEYAVGSKADGKTIDNAILRALRFAAFADFPDIPVFIRDADTLFENILKVRDIRKELAAWEGTLLAVLKGLFAPPAIYRLLIASQPNYHRQWHINPVSGKATTGCYAAVTSSLGGIPEWKDKSLWRKCLAYLRSTSAVIQRGDERMPNDIDKPTYIGKDEQLLSYVIIPEMLAQIYFYYFEYIQVEGTKIMDTSGTPFARDLLAAGYTRYPSPYRVSLGEPMPSLDAPPEKRKDANEKTEGTILSPKYTPLALSAETQDVMQRIFRYYMRTNQTGGLQAKVKAVRSNTRRKKGRRLTKRLQRRRVRR